MAVSPYAGSGIRVIRLGMPPASDTYRVAEVGG